MLCPTQKKFCNCPHKSFYEFLNLTISFIFCWMCSRSLDLLLRVVSLCAGNTGLSFKVFLLCLLFLPSWENHIPCSKAPLLLPPSIIDERIFLCFSNLCSAVAAIWKDDSPIQLRSGLSCHPKCLNDTYNCIFKKYTYKDKKMHDSKHLWYIKMKATDNL